MNNLQTTKVSFCKQQGGKRHTKTSMTMAEAKDKDKGTKTKTKTKDNLQNPGYIAGPCSAVCELDDLLSGGIRQWTTWCFSQRFKLFRN